MDKKNIEEILALTPMQEGMLFHYLKDPQQDYYFEQLILEISAEIDRELFDRAWNFVIHTNEMLRTVFRWEKMNKPIQVVLKQHQIKPIMIDLSAEKIEEKEKRLEKIKVKDRNTKFDLRRVPFRVTLCKLKQHRYVMMISNHHILYDGWSNGILLHEFFNAYNDFSKGKEVIKPVKRKFKEFIQWTQNQDLNRDNQEKFWRNFLKGFDTPTLLAIKKQKRGKKVTLPGKCTAPLDRNLTMELNRFIRRHKITLASFLYAAWGLLLQRYNNRDDIIFGTTVSGRSAKLKGIEDIVGLFINTLPLRIKTIPGERILDCLLRTNDLLQKREEFERSSMVEIREYSEINTDEALFDSIVVIENYPLDIRMPEGKKELSINSYSMFEMTHYDLTAVVTTVEDIKIDLSYNEELLDSDTIKRLSRHFLLLIGTIIRNPGKKIQDIEIISKEEKRQIISDFNDTASDYPHDKTLSQLFAQQVEKRSDNIAVIGEMQSAKCEAQSIERSDERQASCAMRCALTYRELNEKSNQLAHLLLKKGVKPDTIVGLMVERSIEMIIGILGILKVDGAYLPIDPDHPQERINYMLNDSNVNIFLTAREIANLSSPEAFNNRPKGTSSFGIWDLEFVISPRKGGQLVYIIYTSGSTGTPKGVMVENPSVINILAALQKEYPFKESDTYLLKTSYVFDVSVTELFGWFLGGGKCVILEKHDEKDPEKILDKIQQTGVTHINFVPSMFNMFVNGLTPSNTGKLSALRYIFLAGEALLPESVNKFMRLNTNIRLENIYGPTEGTVYSSKYSLTDWDNSGSIPIGSPMQNNKLYILDKYHHLQPIGIPGELCISGEGVARGYLNNPELTKEKFQIPNYKLQTNYKLQITKKPAHELHELTRIRITPNEKFLRGGPGGPHGMGDLLEMAPKNSKFYSRPYALGPRLKLYMTGDLARWLPDGNIEYLGRMDFQIKIRGYRIELGEIENRLLTHKNIKEAVVIARCDASQDKYLCAYFTAVPGINIQELRVYLSQSFPHYMIPRHLMGLEKIPLTPNGKVDRKSLPEPEGGSIVEYAAPRDEIEKKLVKIWSEVLGRDSIGIDDHFFELGGHSLKATRLLARIHQTFDVRLSLEEIFKKPSIRRLSTSIKETLPYGYETIDPVEKKEYYFLSSAQQRLYILAQMEKENIHYNISAAFIMEGDVRHEQLEDAFRQLIERHESLRTSFHIIADEPVQRVHDKVKFEIEYYDLYKTKVEEEHSLVNRNSVEGTRGLAPLPLESAIPNPKQIPIHKLLITNKKETKGHHSSFIIHHLFIVRPFDLSHAPLLRVGLLKIEEKKYLLMVDMHHIISDGLSNQIIANHLAAYYGFKKLPLLRIQYKDYSRWQRGDKEKKLIINQEQYWLKQFAAEIPVLDLPADFARPTVQSFEGSTIKFEIDRKSTDALKKIALDNETTLYMVLLSITNIFLSKISSQEDIVIGTPVAGRRHAELEDIIGMFVNTLALRNQPCGDKTFTWFLKEVKKNTLEAFENQDYPFEELVETLQNITRDAGRNPLFDVMFTFQNREFINIEIPGLTLKSYPFKSGISKFDLTLQSIEREDRLEFTLEYCTTIFRKKTIQRFINYFKRILTSVVREPNIKICELEIISGEEKRKVLYDFNDTETHYPKDKTLHELFAEQVEKNPDNTALHGCMDAWMHGEGHITYRELNHKSNRLAHMLQQKGVIPDTIVGLMVECTVEMIIGIMGILKASGAYLPIDPNYPQERINYMLADSNANMLVTTGTLSEEGERVRRYEGKKNFQRVLLDFSALLPFYPSTLPSSQLHLSPTPVTSLAYVIYTSGSTGNPKGVMIEHRNVANLVFGLKENLYKNFSRNMNIALIASYVFDASVKQIFVSLLSGYRLFIVPDISRGGIGLMKYYRQHKIDISDGTPAHLRLLMEGKKEEELKLNVRVKYFLIGGESLNRELLDRFSLHIEPDTVKIVNVYGPTECCVDSTFFEITKKNMDLHDDKLPIGFPMPDQHVYILNQHNVLQPIGVPGEICISGGNVGRGYLNRPELTAEKFRRIVIRHSSLVIRNFKRAVNSHLSLVISSPSKLSPNDQCLMTNDRSPKLSSNDRIYHTGDLARWLPDGNIEFLGRIDHQVKIRGYRIELEEIENQLLANDDIREVVVTAKEVENQDKYLCAYIVSHKEIETSKIKEYLSHTLPNYMIPSFFVQLEKIPLTPNGKVDRKSLPEPEVGSIVEYAAPRDKIEKKLVEIWSEVLGRDSIGIDANFFDLGGHSLKATILMSKIHRAFGVQLTLSGIFKAPNIRNMALTIKKTAINKPISIQAAEKKEYYPLSSAQKRLYILYQLDPDSINYNISNIVILEGKFAGEKAGETFKKLVLRHESFRTSFELIDNQPVQQVRENIEFEIEYNDLATEDTENTKGTKELAPFPLESAIPNPKQIPNQKLPITNKKETKGHHSSFITHHSFIRPFDLSAAPLLRVGLIKRDEQTHVLMVDMHHIISDGISFEVFVREMINLYVGGQLPEIKLQYKDFSHWLNKRLLMGEIKKQEEYWLKEFQGKPPVMNLPTDYPRPDNSNYEGDAIGFELAAEATAKLKKWAKKENATMFMVVLAIFNILLFKITNQQDIVVGTVISGREHPGVENIIGFFVNTLVLKYHTSGQQTFIQYLRQVREKTLEAFDNQDYQFEELVEKLMVERTPGRNPLFDVFFTFISQNVQHLLSSKTIPEINKSDLNVRPYGGEGRQPTKFDITLGATDSGNNISIVIQYSKQLYKKKTIEKFAEYFKEIMSAVTKNEGIRLRDIKISYDLGVAASEIYQNQAIEFEF